MFETSRGNKYDRKHLWRVIRDESLRTIHKPITPKQLRSFHIVRNIKDGQGIEAVALRSGNVSVKSMGEMYLHSGLLPPSSFDPGLGSEGPAPTRRVQQVTQLLGRIELIYDNLDDDRKKAVDEILRSFLKHLEGK